MSKVALVTGGNKGIGYEVVRGLCKKVKGHVLLGARDEERGRTAVAKLREEGLETEFVQLDLDSKESINNAKSLIEKKYGGLDILINNAGIAYKVGSTAPFSEQAEVTVGTNYFGTLNVCEALFPLLRPGARVVTVSSMAGRLNQVSEGLRMEFSRIDLTVEELNSLMRKFVEAAKEGAHQDKGFSKSAYGMSKLGLIALTKIQARKMAADSRKHILVNTICPGYVSTDMSSHRGLLTPEEGADTPIFVALIPSDQTHPQGEFLQKRLILNWLDISVRK